MVVDALEPRARVTLWRHHHRWPRAARVAGLSAKAFLGSLGAPDFVFYEHVDLARLHALLPPLRRTPYGIFLHGIEVWRRLGGRYPGAIRGARVLAANSATTVALAREFNPWLPEVRVTWLGVPADRGAGPTGPRAPTALIVGRMAASERYKGHDQVLDAWPTIRRAVPEARLVVAGGGDDLPRLRRRAGDEALDGVEFRGWVSDAELRDLYRSSRLFLFPSRREGFGLATAEAASAGMVILGLRGTVIDELFPDGHGAVVVDDLSPASLASAAIPILSDAARAARLGAMARTRVHETFLEEHFAARFRDALGGWLG
jgi:phosphatidylinositol alpha-1,6-mannosyltransferase